MPGSASSSAADAVLMLTTAAGVALAADRPLARCMAVMPGGITAAKSAAATRDANRRMQNLLGRPWRGGSRPCGRSGPRVTEIAQAGARVVRLMGKRRAMRVDAAVDGNGVRKRR